MELTPIMPSYIATQAINAGVAYPSLIPNSSWDPTPTHNEQMDYVSNNNGIYNPAVSEPRANLCQIPVINGIRPGLSNTPLDR